MIDPVNPQDKVVVVAAMAKEEDMLVDIIAHVMCALALNHFRNLIPLYQPQLAK